MKDYVVVSFIIIDLIYHTYIIEVCVSMYNISIYCINYEIDYMEGYDMALRTESWVLRADKFKTINGQSSFSGSCYDSRYRFEFKSSSVTPVKFFISNIDGNNISVTDISDGITEVYTEAQLIDIVKTYNIKIQGVRNDFKAFLTPRMIFNYSEDFREKLTELDIYGMNKWFEFCKSINYVDPFKYVYKPSKEDTSYNRPRVTYSAIASLNENTFDKSLHFKGNTIIPIFVDKFEPFILELIEDEVSNFDFRPFSFYAKYRVCITELRKMLHSYRGNFVDSDSVWLPRVTYNEYNNLKSKNVLSLEELLLLIREADLYDTKLDINEDFSIANFDVGIDWLKNSEYKRDIGYHFYIKDNFNKLLYIYKPYLGIDKVSWDLYNNSFMFEISDRDGGEVVHYNPLEDDVSIAKWNYKVMLIGRHTTMS